MSSWLIITDDSYSIKNITTKNDDDDDGDDGDDEGDDDEDEDEDGDGDDGDGDDNRHEYRQLVKHGGLGKHGGLSSKPCWITGGYSGVLQPIVGKGVMIATRGEHLHVSPKTICFHPLYLGCSEQPWQW